MYTKKSYKKKTLDYFNILLIFFMIFFKWKGDFHYVL